MRAAISVQNLGKRFSTRDRGRPSSLKGRLLSGYRAPKREPFWALRNISFNIPRGRAVGVVGLNGAGKSTLLRLIGGVGTADEGQIRVNGRVGALLDIGVGLTDELTGRENVYLLGVIAGMLRAEVHARFDEIVAFAELEEFIDAPVRTYSTGMRMRLAFAVAVTVQPEILLIDEVLAVGDLAFQRKCLRRVEAIRAAGSTILLVSHDDSQIRALCDDVVLLDHGRLVAYGPLDETMALYDASVDAKVADDEGAPPAFAPLPHARLVPEVNRFGSGEMLIEAVRLTTPEGIATGAIRAGDGLTIEMDYRYVHVDAPPIAVIGIYARDDSCCFETNSALADVVLERRGDSGTIALRITRLDLAPEDYRVTVGLFSGDWAKVYDYHAETYPVRVTGRGTSKGYVNPPLSWHSERAADFVQSTAEGMGQR